jgi:hypothetical protein
MRYRRYRIKLGPRFNQARKFATVPATGRRERPAALLEAEPDLISRLVPHAFLRRRFYNKGVGRRPVLPHDLRVGRRGCLEDVGIDTFIPEQAILAVILPEGADDSSECVAEAAAESGAFV